MIPIPPSQQSRSYRCLFAGPAAFALRLGLLPLLLVLGFLFFGIYEPKFWNLHNLINVLRNASYLMIVSVGQMIVLIMAGFDLSVGAVIALTSVVAAITMGSLAGAMPDAIPLVILGGTTVGLVVGSMIGVVNGLAVALLRVNPFMVTLGTMSIAYGTASYLSFGVPVYGMPEEFMNYFGRMRLFGAPVIVYVTLLILVAIWLVMNTTRLGRYIYAIGSNIDAARVSGISTGYYVVAGYSMCSLLAATTGILLTARVGSGEATLGATLMLQSIAAAVIGGVSLRGGVGRVEMVAFGALFLSLVTNGMNMMHVDSKLQSIVIGIVLIAAVGLDRIELLARKS